MGKTILALRSLTNISHFCFRIVILWFFQLWINVVTPPVCRDRTIFLHYQYQAIHLRKQMYLQNIEKPSMEAKMENGAC